MGKYRTEPKQVFFFLGYGIFVLLVLCRTTFFYQYIMGGTFKAILGLCVCIAVFGEIVCGRGTRPMIAGLLVCFCYIALAIFVKATIYLVLASTVIFIFCSRDIPFKRTAAFSACILAAAFAVVVLSSQIGIIKDYVDTAGGRVRHYLGFLYALYPSTVLMNIIMLAVYVRREMIKWAELILFAAAALIIFKLTNSRLAMILSFFVILFAIFMKFWPYFLVKKNILKRIAALSYLILAAASLMISIKYNENIAWQARINDVLSARLELQHEAMEEYGFSIFGQEINDNGNGLTAEGKKSKDIEKNGYFYIDNVYIQWYTKNGIVFFIVMLLVMTAISFRSITYDRQGYLSVMLALMAVFCLIQDSILYIHFNTFLLCTGNMLLNHENDILHIGHRKRAISVRTHGKNIFPGSSEPICEKLSIRL